jgi:hypothetical protein
VRLALGAARTLTGKMLSEVPLLPQQAWDKTSATGEVGNYDGTTAGAKAVYACPLDALGDQPPPGGPQPPLPPRAAARPSSAGPSTGSTGTSASARDDPRQRTRS